MALCRVSCLAGLTAALLTFPAARAAEVDRLLPADSELVVTVNVRQILESPLFKKHVALKDAQDALTEHLPGEANQILKDLGFDPFTDLDSVTVAGPGGHDKDRGLIVVRGRFDADKIKARAAQAAKDDPDSSRSARSPTGSSTN
jgi:hypothetical protein